MSESEQKSGDVFDLEQIRRLVQLMEEHELSKVDLRQGDQQIRLYRGTPETSAPSTSVPAPAHAAMPAAPAAEDDANITYIKSPMVGTFYAKPNPESEPYVRAGDQVDLETTVCVIEAMKVFNEIPAEVRGQIVAVLVENEEPVEFGKPLFKIDTSK